MRTVITLALITGLIAPPLQAQEPDAVPLFAAVEWPDERIPTIDGTAEDWAWVDPSFAITLDEMHPLTEGRSDGPDDLFVSLLIGWNHYHNRVYSVIEVHDDALVVDKNPTCTFRDDACEVHFDPDNAGGGPYSAPPDRDLQPAYQMCLLFSEQYPRVQMYNGALGTLGADALDFWWTHSGDYVDVALANYDQTYIYEFSALLFDPISISGGPSASNPWLLTAGQTLGIGITIDDADPEEEEQGDGSFWQAQYSTAEQFMNTGGIPDVYLSRTEATPGTLVEATSWGQLKALAGP